MFTGIIRYMGAIVNADKIPSGIRFSLKAPDELISRMEEGITSISVNGACHTVEKLDGNLFTTFSSFETLNKTVTGDFKKGDLVNLELPLTPTTLLDGHLVQGHVDGVGKIAGIRQKGEARLYTFTAGHEIMKYVVEKDSIAVDGISLTAFQVSGESFQVAVIPETVSKTTLSFKKEGASVNLEVNIFAKYASRFGSEKSAKWMEFFSK